MYIMLLQLFPFVDQFFGWRGVDSYVESFLMLLCDSAQVKRNVHLCVKPTRTSGRRTPLDTNRLTTEGECIIGIINKKI